MLKNKLINTILLILIALAFLAIAYSMILYNRTIDSGDKITTVIISQGDSLNKILNQLLDEKVIDSKTIFKIGARLKGVDKKLVPGRYDFSGKNSVKSVLQKLEDADFYKVKITIPEGNTIWETAALLAKSLDIDSAKIHNLNFDTLFLKENDLPYLEGYLFPETYYIAWGTDEKTTVTELINMFKKQTNDLIKDTYYNNLDFREIIILASIIEAETGLVDEREMVSSVYHNRLKQNMKLDADPTVIYGLDGLDRPLYRKDLKKDTPYNTYMNKNLPPTPINSPGLASIKAAIKPAQSDYLFFVADNSGRHIFSKTNAEHNRAIRKIKSEN